MLGSMESHVLLIFFFLAAPSLVHSITKSDLYPHENFESLQQGDDLAFEMEAYPPVHLYEHTFERVYVSACLLLFNRE